MNLPIKNQFHGRALAELGTDLNIAFVPPHDLLGKTESNPGTFLLGCKKWNKN